MPHAPTIAEPRIVCTPGTCGGRPRLDGHRLTIDWYASIRRNHGRKGIEHAHSYIRAGWGYLTEAQIECMAAYYEAHR